MFKTLLFTALLAFLPVYSALDAKVGNFTLTSGDAGTITVTGVGFTGSVVLFLTASTTVSDTVVVDNTVIIGGATATTEITVGQSAEDGVGTTDTQKWGSPDSCLVGLDESGDADYIYTFNAFNSDGFVLNVVSAPASDRVIGYMVLGGDDVNNAYFGTWDLNNASGSVSVTDPNFQGNVVIFCGLPGSNNGSQSAASVGTIGIATGAAAEYNVAWHDETGQATTAIDDQMFNDHVITDMNSNGTIGGQAEFTSFDATGMTINCDNAFGAGRKANYLVMDITNVKVGEFTLQNSTGNFSTTGVGFEPNVLLTLTAFNSDYNIAGSATISIGITDGTNQWFNGISAEDGQGTSDCDKFSNSGELITRYDFAQAKQSSAAVVSLDADGVTLDQTDAEDVDTRKVFYLALGGTAAAVTPASSGSAPKNSFNPNRLMGMGWR